jgi:hypothetical protein
VNTPRIVPTTKPIAKTLLFWSILVLGTLALVEGSTAVYFLLKLSRTYYRPLYLETRNDQWLWRTEHHDWGGWHKPSSSAHHTHNCFSVSYRSNSYGARDKERSLTATGNRAILLGDSFIEGYGVDEEKRLSNLLEKSLGFEILNFGMTHFGPLQYQIIYEQLARHFDHEVVIIGFLPDNDFNGNDPDFWRQKADFARRYRPYYSKDGGIFYPRSRPSPDEAAVFAEHAIDLPERRRLSENVRRLFWLYGLYREIRFNVTVLQYPAPSDYIGYLETDAFRITRATGSILAIQKAAAPRPVLLLFIPDYDSWSHVESHAGSYDRSVVAKLRDILEHKGITTIDLLKEFMNRGLDKDSLYLPCDGHWNQRGHRAAFDVIQPIIRELLETRASLGDPSLARSHTVTDTAPGRP